MSRHRAGVKVAPIRLMLLLVGGVAAGDALAGCESPRILYPTAGAIIAEARPMIAWSTVEGAKRYRVLLRSQVPNGPVIAEFDNWVTAAQFSPPRHLASERANVTVRIVPDCADDVASVRLRGNEHRFAVDPTSACSPPLEVKVAQGALGWQPSPGARGYEVAIFTAQVPAELLRAPISSPPFSIPPALPSGSVAAVRARCATGLSSPVFTSLP